MKFKKIQQVMLIVVLGLVSAYGDISMDVVGKLKGLDQGSFNELKNSLCNISHKSRPIVTGGMIEKDFPVYPDGFRWAEVKIESRNYIRSIEISNRTFPVGRPTYHDLEECASEASISYFSKFHEIRYPVVYFGYFSQNKIVTNMSQEQQNKENKYKAIYKEYSRAEQEVKFEEDELRRSHNDYGMQSIKAALPQIISKAKKNLEEAEANLKEIKDRLHKIEPEVLNNRYKVDNHETHQLRLYFKDYSENKDEYFKSKTLALYIDNPSTEDLGLAMSVCKIAHRCVELTKSIYKTIKKNNYAQEHKLFKESLEAQTKQGLKLTEEQFLMQNRLSRVFMRDFLTYKGKADLIDQAIGGFVGFFSENADSAIRNKYNDLYKAQKPKFLDSNHLMLATIVGVGRKEKLSSNSIKCNVYAYQEGFYRYLFKEIEKILYPNKGQKSDPSVITDVIQVIDNQFLAESGFNKRFHSISDRINGVSNKQTEYCNNLLIQEPKHNYQQYSFLEKRIKLRRHRLSKKFSIGSVVKVFEAIKEFFLKVTGFVVVAANSVVNIVSAVIFGVIYAALVVTEGIGGILKVTTDYIIGETYLSNAFLIPNELVKFVLEPVGKYAHKIMNGTFDPSFYNLLANSVKRFWVQSDFFYQELNKNDPVTFDTYAIYSKKPEAVNAIFRLLLLN